MNDSELLYSAVVNANSYASEMLAIMGRVGLFHPMNRRKASDLLDLSTKFALSVKVVSDLLTREPHLSAYSVPNPPGNAVTSNAAEWLEWGQWFIFRFGEKLLPGIMKVLYG